MKGKVLLLIFIFVIASVTVTAYQVKSSDSQLMPSNLVNSQTPINNNHKNNSQNEISDFSQKSSDSLKSDTSSKSDEKLSNQANSNNNEKSDTKTDTDPQYDTKTSDPQSTAQKYIEEPGAVAGKPEQYIIGGKNTYVVPVLLNGDRVGEIDIDPETGKNVGGAGGAP